MHEVGIMASAMDAVLAQAREHGASRVHLIVLRVGALSGVEPEALRFAFDIVAKDTPADGADLEIDTVPARARCPDCDLEFEAGLRLHLHLPPLFAGSAANSRRAANSNWPASKSPEPPSDAPRNRSRRTRDLPGQADEPRAGPARPARLPPLAGAADLAPGQERPAGGRATAGISSAAGSSPSTSSPRPASGKTTLLERTLDEFGRETRCAVLVGDLETDNDARRLHRPHVPVAQITTGDACHLEAEMVARGVEALDLSGVRVLFIENVGNLVCPASFDLGEEVRVVLLSCTEGEDKPLKYPPIFKSAHVVLLTKIDVAGVLGFDVAAAAGEHPAHRAPGAADRPLGPQRRGNGRLVRFPALAPAARLTPSVSRS